MNRQKSIKEICRDIFMQLFSPFPQRKTIILESRPAFSDNTYAVFQELVRRGISKKYRMIWFVKPEDRIAHLTDSEVFVTRSSFFNSVKKIYLLQTASFVITCNRAYFSTRKNHHNIHLTHGSPLKDTAALMYLDPSYDCLTLAADFFKGFAKRDFNISTAKMVVTGMPRTDYFFCTQNESLRKLVRSDYRKLIIWMPTLRQSGNGKRIDSSYNMPYGIPIFQAEEEWDRLNHMLYQNNSMLIIKYHFAQDTDVVRKKAYSNIKIVGNDYFDEKGIQLYEFLRYTDALITDYSSIYFDYLLLEKPIGLTIDDLAEYSAGRGFLVDDLRTVFKGNYMETFDDLFTFIESVCEGSAEFTSEMKAAKKKYNDYCDGSSSSRVVDYLIEHYNL